MKIEEYSIILKEHEQKEVTTTFTESVKQKIQVYIPAGATYKQQITSYGKHDIQVMYIFYLQGKGASAELKGRLYMQDYGKQDWIVQQIHSAPETSSTTDIKAVITDHSFLNYEGTITIEKSAFKSVAHQEQKNLILGSGARVTSIPNLQVLTHDVQCGHGSAVSYLDDDHLFYLLSRGIPFEKAQQMVIEGFLL